MKISGFGQQYKNIKRYRQIIAVLLKYGFQDVLDRLRIYTYLGLGRRLIFRKKVEIESGDAMRQRVTQNNGQN